MEFKTTLEIVTKDIQDIEKLVGNFKNYSRIPNIELDLALARLRNVYDLLLLFKSDNTEATLTAGSGESSRNTITDTKEEIKEAAPAEGEIPVQEKPAPSPEPVTLSSPKGQPQPEPQPQPQPQPQPASASDYTETPLKTPAPPSAPVPPPTAKEKPVDRQEEEIKFIHEKLGEQVTKKDISSKLQGQAIKSIAGSIGINDKFLYIRELFAGSAENFRQTMDELDECHNFNDAYSLLMDRFQWDMDSEPVQMLLNLVRRKFITTGNE